MTKKLKQDRDRLLGIELMRGVAVFAVVLSHSGDGTWGEMTTGVEYLRELFSFHVPFFLAVSFYFLSQKLVSNQGSSYPPSSLRRRCQRILIPYIVWSIIYVFIRCVFFVVDGDYNKLSKLLDDFSSLVFLGGASYHLYFLPLLLCGTITFYVVSLLNNRWNS
jgi:peptidoglycan/LPS O-acetylase OafA/YrhL